jgi:hypothetical protein
VTVKPADLHEADGNEPALTDIDNEPALTDVGGSEATCTNIDGSEATCTNIDGDESARITSDHSNVAAVETIADSKPIKECATADNSKKHEAQTETVDNKHARCEDAQDEYNSTNKPKAEDTPKDKIKGTGPADAANTAPEVPKVVIPGSYIPGSPEPPTAEQLQELRSNVQLLFSVQISFNLVRRMGLSNSRSLEEAQESYRKLAAELHRWEDKDKLPEWAGKPEDNFAMPGWAEDVVTDAIANGARRGGRR